MNTVNEDRNINQVIQEVEETYFFGRTKELELFHNLIQSENPEWKIIHLFGKGGIGKTYLLYEFAIMAKKNNIPFIHLDTQDFSHTIQDFINYLHSMLTTQLNLDDNTPKSLQSCIQLINNFDGKIIFAVDTYEQMDTLDRWFRNVFIRKLHPRVTVILAGRKELAGEWQESPAWRKVTRQIKISSFSYEETSNFLKNYGVVSEAIVKKIWNFTNGHPLLLSLATIGDFTNEENMNIFKNNVEVLSTLTNRWLSEAKDENLIKLIEIAALFHHFDQYTITEILRHEIPNNKFRDLISLSFIRKTQEGWSIHELVRDAIRVELKQRNPKRYELLRKKIIQYYYHQIVAHPTKEDIASFFYHLGDDVIQSVFFQDTLIDASMYLEPIGDYNFNEVENFFSYLKMHTTVSKTNYYNRTSNKSYNFDASLEHNQLEQELMGPEYIKKMGYNGASLLKRKNGEIIGISINVPINEQTLPLLENEPVSRAYFANLSEEERSYYNVPVEETSGYFIRYQDYKDPTDNAARGYLLYSLFPLIFSGGKIIASTPLPFFQDLLYKFGFKTVDGAEHNDYLEKEPTPTFLLDLSGPNLIPYLQQYIAGLTAHNRVDILTQEFSLTNREKDIMGLILEDKPISEIANDLFIAEITVKKALSRIYQKAKVKNRMQLMKRIMEIT